MLFRHTDLNLHKDPGQVGASGYSEGGRGAQGGRRGGLALKSIPLEKERHGGDHTPHKLLKENPCCNLCVRL